MIDDAKLLVESEEDYVNVKRFNYSLKRLMERHPDGIPDRLIAVALMIQEAEVEARYQEVVAKLRRLMNVAL